MLFKYVPDSFLNSFIEQKNFRIAKKGTLFFSADDETNQMCLIIEGEVKIKHIDQKNIERRYLLEFFGEKETIDKTSRT